MAYPSFAQLVGSAVVVRDGRVVVRDEGGDAHASSLYDAIKRDFRVKHLLSTADVATLYAHLSANLATSFDFVWALDGATYTCFYGPGGVNVVPGSVFHDVTVDLIGA
jgi:hypothetical protein